MDFAAAGEQFISISAQRQGPPDVFQDCKSALPASLAAKQGRAGSHKVAYAFAGAGRRSEEDGARHGTGGGNCGAGRAVAHGALVRTGISTAGGAVQIRGALGVAPDR